IMAAPMRSLTLPRGLKNSHLSRMTASRPAVTLLRRTRGVRPTVSTILLKICAINFQNWVFTLTQSGDDFWPYCAAGQALFLQLSGSWVSIQGDASGLGRAVLARTMISAVRRWD